MPANTSPMPDGEYRPVCECVWRQMHSRLGADSVVSGSRDGCVWEQRRMRLGAEALTGIGNGGRSTVVRLAGRVRGGLSSVLRGTNIIASFAKYLSSFTLRKVSYSASLFSAVWKFVSSSLLICQKRFKCQNNFDCLLIICKFAGNPMESYGGGVFSACRQKPFPTTPQGRDREDWGIP